MKQLAFLLSLVFLSSCSQKNIPWVELSPEDWPPIALINKVKYKNGDQYIHSSFEYAGTGFLIDNEGELLAATAKHVLWIAANKNSNAVMINEDLQEWLMTTKDSSENSVHIDQLINEDPEEVLQGPQSSILERDWLLFSVKNITGNIQALKPRYSPVQVGEKVYVLSCAYSNPDCTITESKILRKEGMDLLIEKVSEENIGGSSGSPVIDAEGNLIGILSSSTKDNTTGKDVIVAVSTEYLKNVLDKKPNLNKAKKDYGELIFNIALEKGAKEAIALYRELKSAQKNYYQYNLRSANRNGLREAGIKLMEATKIQEAIEIFELNIQENSHFYLNYNLLAEAYLKVGNKKSAIQNYKISTEKYTNAEENEAFSALEQLKNK